MLSMKKIVLGSTTRQNREDPSERIGNPVKGVLIKFGDAPFMFDKQELPNYFATVRSELGRRRFGPGSAESHA